MKKYIIISILGIWLCLFLLTGCDETEEYVIANPESRTEQVTLQSENDTDEGEGADPDTGEEETTIFVHVCGAVRKPEVYELDASARLYEAIAAAGGFREDACEDALNLAAPLTDGEKIYVPTVAEAEAVAAGAPAFEEAADDGRININTADVAALCSLPGIGESRAEAIIAYREEHGEFQKIEDIMEVSGIKEGMYAKLKDRIKV